MTHAPRCVCDACWPTRLREMRALIEAAARRLGEQMLRRARSVSLPDGLDWLATGRWNDEAPAVLRQLDMTAPIRGRASARRRAAKVKQQIERDLRPFRDVPHRRAAAQVVDPPPPFFLSPPSITPRAAAKSPPPRARRDCRGHPRSSRRAPSHRRARSSRVAIRRHHQPRPTCRA